MYSITNPHTCTYRLMLPYDPSYACLSLACVFSCVRHFSEQQLSLLSFPSSSFSNTTNDNRNSCAFPVLHSVFHLRDVPLMSQPYIYRCLEEKIVYITTVLIAAAANAQSYAYTQPYAYSIVDIAQVIFDIVSAAKAECDG